MEKGIHPTTIAESFQHASEKAVEYLNELSVKLDLDDRESLLKAATTSLNSKIVSQYSSLLSPIAVDSVLSVIDPKTAVNVDLKDIRLVKKIGGTIDDTELSDGLVLAQNVVKVCAGFFILGCRRTNQDRKGQDCLDSVPSLSSQTRHGQSNCRERL